MRRQIVAGVCLMLLFVGSAHAADNGKKTAEQEKTDKVDLACVQQLALAEKLVHDKAEAKALSEADEHRANKLLDQADAFCTEGNTKQAKATLGDVTKLVSAPEE
jgi:hypothetical protein